MPLTEAEISQHCKDLLDPVTRYVAKSLGDEASDHTGLCLWQALQKYDPSKGNLIPFAKTKTRLLVIEAMRQLDGRKGSAKYAANSTKTQIEDFDGQYTDQEVGRAAEASEALAKTMKRIEIAASYQRWIMIGRALCNFTPQTEAARFQKFFDVSPSVVTSQAAAIRYLPD